jgi:hypothetical protein
MLRNPNYLNLGTSYPDNVYDIEKRTVITGSVSSVVIIYLRGYSDEQKTYPTFSENHFELTGLPLDPSLLTPGLYQTELLVQYPLKIVDGTALEDFIVVL